ncbi:MAG: arsenite methyltransferase, partial [Promethearchaeota archaeon]
EAIEPFETKKKGNNDDEKNVTTMDEVSEEKDISGSPCCGSSSTEAIEPFETKKKGNNDDEKNVTTMDEDNVRQTVRERYANIATGQGTSSASNSEEQSETPKEQSNLMGYSKEDLQSIPKGSNLGLGSGNPVALASIQPGEVVVDLGSGAGVDCFLAAKRTGETGKVIGIDMTPQMIDKARANAKQGGYPNVEFRLGEIEHMPVADNTADLIISNCVINLSPDKTQVFRDAYRVLKPGGRLMVSDILLSNELPEVVKQALETTVSCVSRAWLTEDYLGAIKAAGFEEVQVVDHTIIAPRTPPKELEEGKRIRTLIAYGRKIEIELTSEEDEKLQKSIMAAHIKAIKSN